MKFHSVSHEAKESRRKVCKRVGSSPRHVFEKTVTQAAGKDRQNQLAYQCASNPLIQLSPVGRKSRVFSSKMALKWSRE